MMRARFLRYTKPIIARMSTLSVEPNHYQKMLQVSANRNKPDIKYVCCNLFECRKMLKEIVMDSEKRTSILINEMDKHLTDNIKSIDKHLTDNIKSIDKHLTDNIKSIDKHLTNNTKWMTLGLIALASICGITSAFIIYHLDNIDINLSTTKADMNEIKKDTNGIKADIKEIKEDMNEIKADIKEIKEDMNEVKTDIKEILSRLPK